MVVCRRRQSLCGRGSRRGCGNLVVGALLWRGSNLLLLLLLQLLGRGRDWVGVLL